jgi:hypothetical protein
VRIASLRLERIDRPDRAAAQRAIMLAGGKSHSALELERGESNR